MASELLPRAREWVRKQPLRTWLGVGAAIVIGVYLLLFVVPRPVQFSYASEKTCIGWLTLLPALHKTTNSSQFMVSTEGGLKIGNVPIVSIKSCVTSTAAPHEGNTSVAFSPFGGWLFQQRLSVAISSPPKLSATAVPQSPIPTAKPLQLQLESADVIHAYGVNIEGKEVSCSVKAESAYLECDLPSLHLAQGKEYEIKVVRGFSTGKKEPILSSKIETLTATTITEGSIKNGETVYTRPTELTFTADKSLKKARATIVASESGEAITATTAVQDGTITVTLDKELAREKSYTLTIDAVEASDGSSLTDPYKVTFTMSGGPKVTGVSVGKAGVATNASIVVSFDQALSDKQDITKLVTISGATAQITRKGNQVIYSLQGAGLCTPFALSVTKGIQSAYDISATSGWSYSSRTICHTTSIYGYSVQGRALVAYSFGSSGPLTMYVGAIHGNESSSSGLMKAWVDDLEANPDLYGGKQIVVVPTINPDGVAAGSRTNARGVNLNRNFPTDGWVKDINDTDGYHEGGGGLEPLSEPEAKALANLTTSLRPRLLLSFHAIGSLVTGDPGGYSASYAAKYASMVGYRDATGQSGTFDYDVTGAYEDWTYSKQGIPSMVIELGSYGYYNFSYHQAALRAMLN